MASDTTRAGRNELCPCGSGKKHKRCCGAGEGDQSDAASSFFGIAAAITAVMLVIAVVALARSFLEPPPQRIWSAEHGHYHTVQGGEPSGDSSTPGPGKVWSEEHGHYHDTGGSTEAGPGKVWNEEHGHYHNADGSHIQANSAEKPVTGALDERKREMADEAAQKAGGPAH